MAQDQAWLGVGLVLAAGAVNGTSMLPFKFLRYWNWENVWVPYSLVSMFLVPWTVIACTIPGIWQVYRNASVGALASMVFFGGAWGVGNVLYGLGVARLGMAMSFALINGITAAFGSLVPLLVLHPEELPTAQGISVFLGVGMMVIGISICAWAGKIKSDVLQKQAGLRNDSVSSPAKSAFFSGLMICIFSGIFSSMLNYSFAFGAELISSAEKAGAGPIQAPNVVWGIALSSGLLVNLGYGFFLLQKNKSWSHFKRKGTFPGHWALAFVMGLLWASGIFTYGIGAGQLGDLGSVVGWPLIISAAIITANVWGLITREWKDTGHRPLLVMSLGVTVLVLSIFLLAYAKKG